MELKDISKRLEIIKLSISVNDNDTIKLQSNYLKSLNNLKLNEIVSLLESKNYRQALYLIKKFKEDNNLTLEESPVVSEEKEYVLNVDDMLKMSPIAKESISQYKESSYSADDIEAFSKNITARREEAPQEITPEDVIELPPEESEDEKEPLTYAKKEEDKETKEALNQAIEDVNKDTPLDEISSVVTKNNEKKKRTQVISSYKTLRSKFAKKDKTNDNEKKEKNESNGFLNRVKNIKKNKEHKEAKAETLAPTQNGNNENIKKDEKKSEQIEKNIKNDIYPPIPHIEKKFRQAFVLYPPIKESEIWVEEVAKFLKYIANNSYTDNDLAKFMDEYQHYLDKGDIARASQFLLLAGSTDAKYPQFLLARELFKGKILRRNIKKSFDIMSKLANSGYPDAICDLGQFYEYGIGMPENKKTALKLYEKAFELGLQRATKHINRVKESQGGLFSALKKLIK